MSALPAAFHPDIAARLGVSPADLERSTSRRAVWLTPGLLVEGEKPLPVGAVINLRRQFPGTPEAERDLGWHVVGYTRKSDGRWLGHVLVRKRAGLEFSSVSGFEAFDVVSR